ncbi:MAG: putative uncharacterized protein gp74 [Rhodospirillaceae bacterium]|nr:MAG: putative uncharacterized protein gp74 [Rhodospirillaceae bacterium]
MAGPATATAGALAVYGDTTGKVLHNGPDPGTAGQVLTSTGPNTAPTFQNPGASSSALTVGKHTLWIPAGGMAPNTTNGPLWTTTELSTNKNRLKTLNFSAPTQQFAQFDIGMPPSWDEGTITFQPLWTAAGGTGGVVWALDAVSTSDSDPMDSSFGTEQTSTDTFLTANACHIPPPPPPPPRGGDRVNCRTHRGPCQ